MTIREAKPEEAQAIITFQQKMAMETEEMELDYSRISAGVKAVFDDPAKGRYYLAEENGKVIASLMITPEWSDWRNAMVWWFQSVYVLPEARRKGVFRQMYAYIKTLAEEKKIGGLRLYVEKDNIRAQHTYIAMGMDGEHYKMFEQML